MSGINYAGSLRVVWDRLNNMYDNHPRLGEESFCDETHKRQPP